MDVRIISGGLFICSVISGFLAFICGKKERELLFHPWQVERNIFEEAEKTKKRRFLRFLKKLFYFLAIAFLILFILSFLFIET